MHFIILPRTKASKSSYYTVAKLKVFFFLYIISMYLLLYYYVYSTVKHDISNITFDIIRGV